MEEFSNQINQIREDVEQFDNVDINQFVNETERIGQQLRNSQDFLRKEIQRLKQDLDANYEKINYANELRDIDQKTLTTFKTKFQELTRILSDVKAKEINTWHLVQLLRVNNSRLWQIFETATGTTITQELIYEDFQKLLQLTQIEKDDQTTSLVLLEKEHGDLLLTMKGIQISLEQFRTTILHMTQNTNEIKFKIQTQQQINDRTHEQSIKRLNHLVLNTKDVQAFLLDYQSLVNDIHQLLKLIFHVQTQIEIHHKTTLIYQTKLEKYKQDFTLTIINRTNYDHQISDLQKHIHQQTQNCKQLEHQQIQINHNRQRLHRHIQSLEKQNNRILNDQQQLLDTIKQTTMKNHLLDKEILRSNHAMKDLQHSFRQLIKDQNKQQHISNKLHKTIECNEQHLQIIKVEINQLTEHVKQQNDLVSSKENQIHLYAKELLDLENCFSIAQEELITEQTKVNESKAKVKLLTQKMHRLTTDKKPLMKEISHYQKQVTQNEFSHHELQIKFRQNEAKIIQYQAIISKLIVDSKQNDRLLTQENVLIRQCYSEQEKSKENINRLNSNLKYSEYNYQNLKEIFDDVENENKQLKQKHTHLNFVVQLLGQNQAAVSNKLQPLYREIKRLTNQYNKTVKTIKQSKSDLNILHKYYLQLRAHNHQLDQSLSFKSEQYYEYLNSQSQSHQLANFQNQLEEELKTNSNHIHYWHTLRISSPDEFNKIAKLFLIKTKLVKKSNELNYLKKIFNEKQTLSCYLNQIYCRREKLLQKMSTSDILKDQLIKQKMLRKELQLNKDKCENTGYNKFI